jgi:DnaK suppressor protein
MRMQTETGHDPLAKPVKGRAGSVGARAGPAGDTALPTGDTALPTGDKAGPAGDRAGPAGAPRWRALLEARWRSRLQEVTELALAYHDAAAAGLGTSGGHHVRLRLRALLRQTVASRQALADTEEALARLAAGTYGWCESCGDAIAAQRLAVTPETRYCDRCAQEPRPQTPGRGRASRPGLVT